MEFKDGQVPAMFENMKCLVMGEHFANESYAQVYLRSNPVDEECMETLTFKNEANSNFLTFNIKVYPEWTPQGELFETNKFEMNSDVDVHMTPNSFVTFRMYGENGKYPFYPS